MGFGLAIGSQFRNTKKGEDVMKKIVLLFVLICAASSVFAEQPQLLCRFSPQATTVPGNGSDQVVYSCSIPRGDIGSDSICVNYKFAFQHTGLTPVAYDVKFDTTTIMGGLQTASQHVLVISGTWCASGGLNQFFFSEPVVGGSKILLGATAGTSTEVTQGAGADLPLTFNFNAASTDSVVGLGGIVQLSGSQQVF